MINVISLALLAAFAGTGSLQKSPATRALTPRPVVADMSETATVPQQTHVALARFTVLPRTSFSVAGVMISSSIRGTPFADFVQQLIAQAYMFLGMLRSPHAPKPVVDVAAARDMIEILTMLKEKTASNLTPPEDDFLSTHLGELKLAFVQRTKTI